MNRNFASRTLAAITAMGVLGVSLIFPGQALASFGVSPSNILHEQLRPGTRYEKIITLSRSGDMEALKIQVEPSLDEMEGWFTFEPGLSFTFPANQSRMEMKVLVDVPANAELKHHEGVIRIKAMNDQELAGGVAIVRGARVQVDLVTTELDIVELNVKNLRMDDVQGGDPLRLHMTVENNGTTPASPWVRLTNLNLLQDPLETLEARDLEPVPPNESKEITAEFDTQLGTGEYFAMVEVMQDDQVIRKDRLVFRIIDRAEGDPQLSDRDQMAAGTLINSLSGFLTSPAGLLLLAAAAALIAGGYITLGGGSLFGVSLAGKRRSKAKTKSAEMADAMSRPVHLVYILAVVAATLVAGKILMDRQSAAGVELSAPGAEQQTAEPTPEPTPTPEAPAEEEPAIEPTEVTAPEDGEEAGQQEATDSGDVQGAMTVSSDQDYEPLVVKDSSGPGYPVYAEQSTMSEEIYRASEDEQFSVLDETSRWYRIELPDGRDGWLSKNSVKRAE